MRFRRDVTAASRLKVLTGAFKGAILNIDGPPIPDARSSGLEILCSQRGGNVTDFSLDFSGPADIARDLELLSRAESNKVLRDASRAGAEVIRGRLLTMRQSEPEN